MCIPHQFMLEAPSAYRDGIVCCPKPLGDRCQSCRRIWVGRDEVNPADVVSTRV